MPYPPISTFNTNDTPNSQHKITLGCWYQWSLGQQAAYSRLSEQDPENFGIWGQPKLVLISTFSKRAARIAATYARFYLEEEPGCDKAHKGRFYWAGLAAFASKQVKCALEFVEALPDAGLPAVTVAMGAAKNGGREYLGKGNLWIFQDVFVWHWFYALYPNKWDECAAERNAQAFDAPVRDNVEKLPWAKEALPVLRQLALTGDLKDGFEAQREFEKLTRGDLKGGEKQLASLLSIAKHEQLNILQPLIYESSVFRAELELQRAMEWLPFMPQRVVVFASTCDTIDPELKVKMIEGRLYVAGSRLGTTT
jgi:hypothetical protein